MRTRMDPRAALSLIETHINGETYGIGERLAVRNAVEDLRVFVDDMLHEMPVDRDKLALLLGEAEWEWREDYGCWFAYHGVGGPIADVLNWTCSSCRDDVGWADWTSARKSAEGQITLHVECGHCGADYIYDDDGDQIN